MASFTERTKADAICYRVIEAIHDASAWQNTDDIDQAIAAIEEAREHLHELEEVLEKRSVER